MIEHYQKSADSKNISLLDNNEVGGLVKKYAQIRVKSTNFLSKDSTAIYFYDMTRQIESFIRDTNAGQVVRVVNKTNMINYQLAVSTGFRKPISTSLMFLQGLLSMNLSQQVTSMLVVVIAQINMLTATVNDVLDLKLIDED